MIYSQPPLKQEIVEAPSANEFGLYRRPRKRRRYPDVRPWTVRSASLASPREVDGKSHNRRCCNVLRQAVPENFPSKNRKREAPRRFARGFRLSAFGFATVPLLSPCSLPSSINSSFD